jgi:hypothetical protein
MNSVHSIQSAANLHLSDEQIDDHLIGDLAAEPAAHLAACAHCAQRASAAAAPIASFESVTMAWSERRSATLPIPELAAQRPLWQRHMTTAMAGFTFVLGFALINANHQFASTDLAPAHSTHQAATARVIFPSAVFTHTTGVHLDHPAAQITADNQMLKAVDTELEASADSPSALGLEPVSAEAPRSSTTVSVQD